MEFVRNRHERIEVSDLEMKKFNAILEFITQSSGFTKDQILSNQKAGNNHKLAVIRQQIVFLCLKYTALPNTTISKLLGFRSGYVSNVIFRKSRLFKIAEKIERPFVELTGLLPVEGYYSRLSPTDNLPDE